MRAHHPTSEPLGQWKGAARLPIGLHTPTSASPRCYVAVLQASRPGRQLPGAQVLSIMAKWKGWTSCHSWSLRSAVSFGNWGSFQDFHSLAPPFDFEVQGCMWFPRDCPGSRQIHQGFQAPTHHPKVQLRPMVACSFSSGDHPPRAPASPESALCPELQSGPVSNLPR